MINNYLFEREKLERNFELTATVGNICRVNIPSINANPKYVETCRSQYRNEMASI